MGAIRQLIDKKILKILELLLKNKQKYSHLSKISEKSNIPLASTFRIINQLSSLGIVEVTLIGKMKIYRIASNEQTKELEQMFRGKLKQKKSQIKI